MEFAPAQHKRAPVVLSPQLRIGPAHDPQEAQADRIADAVMASATPHLSFFPPDSSPPGIRRCACGSASSGGECDACRKSREDPEINLQRKPATASSPAFAPPLVRQVLSAPGHAIDPSARPFLERRFGFDFSRIRIHNDASAHRSADAIQANAYTAGDHIVFARGKYQPATTPGRWLLAHELAHTFQQRHHPVQKLQRSPGPKPPSIAADTDLSAITARLTEIIRTGPLPNQTRVIASAIVDVPGYTGPREIRALSAIATDALGEGAPVYHAGAPGGGAGGATSATRSIAGGGARREFPFSHVNDAERKIFEDLTPRLPPNAKGTVHFLTERVRIVNGQPVFEPIPACSGCTQATFQVSGGDVEYISHAATHPSPTLNLGSLAENKVNPPPEVKSTSGPEASKGLGEAKGTGPAKALGEAEGGLGTKALGEVSELEGGVAAAADEGVAAEATLGTRALGKAGGIAIGIALIAGFVLWELTVEPKLAKLRATVEGYKAKRRKEFLARIQQDFQQRGADQVGNVLKSCRLVQLKEAEKQGKKSYVHVSLNVTYRDNRIIFTHGDPEAPLDLDYVSSEVVGISVDEAVQAGSVGPLVQSDEKSFLTGSQIFWTQLLHFSFEAPSAAQIEKEYGKNDDVLNCKTGSCFIATACYGTSLAPELDNLRAFRDRILARSPAGRAFVRSYYRHSTPIALFLWNHKAARLAVRYTLIAPLVRTIRLCMPPE